MADIELVIKIPEEMYAQIMDKNGIDTLLIPYSDIIRNGIPLSKGHRELKDIGKCDRKMFYQQCGGAESLITVKTAFDMLLSLPTILNADKAESGED